MVAIIIIFVLKFPTIKIVIIMVLLLSSILFFISTTTINISAIRYY